MPRITRASRRIVIDVYDHTSDEEIAEIIRDIAGTLGIDGAYVVTDCRYCEKAHDPRLYCHEA